MKKRILNFVLIAIMFASVAGCGPDSVIRVSTTVPNTQEGTPAPDGRINVPGVSIQIYAPGPNPSVNTADAHGRVAGLLLGLWHGVISPVTLVVSFFNPDVQMYEVHNDGSQYNLGFLLGVALVFLVLGGLVGSSRR
jgi:hypothetical protein